MEELCFWCTIKRDDVVEFLEQYATSHLSQDQFQTATDDLNVCADCVSAYHLARSQVPQLHKRLWELEMSRLLARFSQLTQDELEDDLFIVEDNQEMPVSKMTLQEFEAAVQVPLLEILQYPYLLANAKLSDLSLDALCRIESIEIAEKYKGVYLLLVHPNEKVRSWAIRTAQDLGRVDRDDFYDVEEVLACMFCVLELGISFTLEDSDPPAACNGKLVRMPTHLYDSSNVKNYWLGICMLLTQLDAQAMDSLFLGPNKQTNILQCILNAMEDDEREFDSTSDPFWPALQCFMVILDRLGSLIWGYIEPIKAFNTITDSSTYISEIEAIRSNSTRVNVKREIEDEDLVTCSQMVYGTFLQQKSSQSHKSSRKEELDQVYENMASLVKLRQTELGEELHLYNSTFLWFIPFVRSVMNMAELSIHYIQPVVQYLRDQVRKVVTKSAIWDKVTVFFAYLLVHVVELLVTEERMDILQHCSNMWVKIIVKGAMMDNMATEGFERSVSSSSSVLAAGRCARGALTGPGSALHVACLKVIRLVLKEGGRLGPEAHSRTFYFLNLLNKHLRDANSRGWSLSVSEQNELQQCLKHLAESLAAKAKMSPSTNASVSALPTPPAESAAMESPFAGCVPLRSIKEEPLSNHELGSSPVREMDCTDYVKEEIPHLKPDLGKLQAIRSRLNENLPKMQAILQNKPSGEGAVNPLNLVSEGKRPPGSPHPSTSYCDQIPDCQEEEDDDVPLNVMQERLKRGKTDEREDKSDLSIIVISDEDMPSIIGVESGDDMEPLFKIKKEQKSMVDSPGRDFDGALSESQVFEFETQEDLASAWGETHFDSANLKTGSSKGPVIAGREPEFVKPTSPPPKVPSKNLKPPPPIIEPQPLKKKRGSIARQVGPATNNEATVETSSPSRASVGTPAIVPPKKVREVPEPESTVERLGLKKRKRKAFDLSQRSLNCVEELRRYGQTVQVEKKVKRLCISKPTSSHNKTKGKNQKLLASQEMQFHRLSRNPLQKASVTSPTRITTPTSPTRLALKAKSHIGEKKGEDKSNNDANMQSCDLDQRPNGSGDGTPAGAIPEVDNGHNEKQSDDLDDHDWNLTLLDPTDMELCSQMELFEENDDESVFLTQRDPVDMDISDEDEPRETRPSVPEEQPEEPASPSVPPSLPQTSTATSSAMQQSDDSSKPDMTQKKPRPSTTKIYTPSSRNDTLVKDMEKLPCPKPKLAHQALMPPPALPPPKRPSAPPAFRPTSIVKPTPPPPRPAQVCHKPAPQPPPTYKTYPRPEASSSSSRQPPFTHNLRASVLKANILKWKYNFFNEYKQFGSPEALCDLPLKQVPQTFQSFADYYNTFFPLLLTNTFEELVTEWLKGDRVRLKLMVQSVDYGSLDTGLFTVTNANFIANLTFEQESQQLYPKEDDVVILWLPQNTGSYTHLHLSDEQKSEDCQPHFGVVSRSNVINAGARRELKVKVQTRGNVLSIDKQLVQCEVVGSMLSAMRELNALCHIRDKALIRTILTPDTHFAHFLPASNQLDAKFEGCNIDQAKAIDCGVSMVMSDQPTPKICMIHGPPGTGKSDTIVNLLYQLSLRGATDPTGRKRLHALVCAPSNAAVDNLMKKIIVFFKGKTIDGKIKGNCGAINLVRLGSERTICQDVVQFGLDRQTKSRTEKAQSLAKELEQRISYLEQNMQNLTHMCAMAQDPAKLAQLREKNLKYKEERERLSHQMKQCKNGKQNTQRIILQEANIICCTLSTSGSIVLESAFRRRGRVPFNCVIVDEAGQAKETETLIPLLFRCPSLVLVGDPEQLPPTVISQKTKELGFDQSLMARLYKCLHRQSPPRIHFLSQQYRMHIDICSFPSRYIYNNLLKTDNALAETRCTKDWACEPYRVFDVADGQEMRENESYFNPKEVKLTLELVQLVIDKYRSISQTLRGVVGVITPYSGQKFQIRQALRKRNLSRVVVDTVDGFQGREMDCIIVSCVRASNEMGSIGFLGNRHRLNVTITRAKYSLFILGHLRTLREHSDWRALIEDAESRGTIITTKEQYFKTDAQKVFKRDALALPPPHHRSQDGPPHHRERFQLSRSNSTPSNPNTLRVPGSVHRAIEHPHDPRSRNTSSGTMSSRSISSTTARGQDPADRPRDPRLQGNSLNAAPSRHLPLRASRDRHDSYDRDRRRPSPDRSALSNSGVRRSNSFSHQSHEYSRKERH